MIATSLHPVAAAAAKAARNWTAWGPFAASRFASKRGVPLRLLALARRLAADERIAR